MTCAPKLALPTEEEAAAGQAPAFVIDAEAGAILDANAAGRAAWGLVGTSAGLPLPIDRAMPALARLPRIAGTGGVETLAFWSARGILRLVCRVEPAGPPDSGHFLVQAVERPPEPRPA